MSEITTGFYPAAPSLNQTQPAHNFALVVFAPPEVSSAVDNIRRRYDPATKDGLQPHITIKRPTILPNPALFPKMRVALEAACLKLSPFQVELDGYNVFHKPGRNVVYLKVQDEKPFCALHMNILQALKTVIPGGGADQYEGSVYHPHLTIGNSLSDLDLAVMEYELKNGAYRLNFTFSISEISLYSQPPGQLWSSTEKFALGTPVK